MHIASSLCVAAMRTREVEQCSAPLQHCLVKEKTITPEIQHAGTSHCAGDDTLLITL